ncbi:MAG: GNAT family N-acetyltransferase [Caldilineaceae bacterium]|nr:GNAT family N-acetyltransferase [Caldilineaceae bacterium]
MNTEIRVLTEADAAPYQALRLRSLQEHPEAFGSAYADEVGRSIAMIQERLQASEHRFTLGACQDNRLVGIVSFGRSLGVKVCHRGGVGGMYVAPEAQGQGLGKQLLTELIRRAHLMAGLEEIILAVTVGNGAARSIYLAAGFAPAYVEERYIKVADRYYDIEWMTLRLGK